MVNQVLVVNAGNRVAFLRTPSSSAGGEDLRGELSLAPADWDDACRAIVHERVIAVPRLGDMLGQGGLAWRGRLLGLPTPRDDRPVRVRHASHESLSPNCLCLCALAVCV